MLALMQRPAAVVFDMDGLLLDTERLNREAMLSACRALGFTMSDALHSTLVGVSLDQEEKRLREEFGQHFDFHAYDALCNEYVEKACEQGVPLRPGAREILEWLDAELIPKAVSTSSITAKAEDWLAKAGLRQMFDAVVGRDQVAEGKPNPQSYLLAAQRLGTNPSDCLALEDSNLGARAAIAAGMVTILVPDLIQPDPTLADLGVVFRPTLLDVVADLRATSARHG